MPIDTDFKFANFETPVSRPFGLLAESVHPDLLGDLRGFVGPSAKRVWTGAGYNMIWRPNHKQSGAKDFFLELNMTEETLDFTDITGSGIANRGFRQSDIALGGLSYLQTISDIKRGPQHFEPGVWVNIPATTDPAEPKSVARMGSIPHGTTVNMQGFSLTVPSPFKPKIDPASITPFTIGSPDDGKTGLVHFPEEKSIAMAMPSRTPLSDVVGLDDHHLADPNLFLHDALASLTCLATKAIVVTSEVKAAPPPPAPPSPSAGGGSASIAFLVGSAAGPNASAARSSATFWIERVRDQHGLEFDQLQYTQRVLLNFNGLSWPHITVATLR